MLYYIIYLQGRHVFIFNLKFKFIGRFSIHTYWRGVPDDIDAVFRWSGNGKIYFIKGNTNPGTNLAFHSSLCIAFAGGCFHSFSRFFFFFFLVLVLVFVFCFFLLSLFCASI